MRKGEERKKRKKRRRGRNGHDEYGCSLIGYLVTGRLSMGGKKVANNLK